MKLYVGNLSFNTTNQDLNELFGTVGTVESSNIIEDRETGRSRGFGFVEMSSQADGEKAIAELNGKEVAADNNGNGRCQPLIQLPFDAGRTDTCPWPGNARPRRAHR